MYIKSIVIDGFKSYGTRTEIKGFDREFNAITGLNGTGKSNILDSICFVLGITNLTHVRAQSLQDLIYKSGQAGVTKASVSIVFDNSDRTKSPLNFEECPEITVTRQIVVAGKNRYMINGSTVTNKSVNDFFNSIQLNVNNPHFLIMQGRITKVLNMKPPEILSMIEEAAGTRMYESKKIGAQKTIQKKDTRLKEINDIVAEQVKPKIDRLKQDRSQYFEFQKLQRDSEQCTRIVVASNVIKSEDAIKDSKEKKEKTQKKIEDTKKYIEDAKLKIDELEENLKTCQNKIDRESGGKLEELESELKEAENAEAKSLATVKNKKESVTEETRKQKTLQKNLKEDEKVLKAKRAELDGAQDVFDRLRQDEQQDAEDLARAQEKFQNVQKGLLSNEDGEDATLQEQLMAAKQHASETETEINQRTVEIKYLKEDLMKKKPLLKNTDSNFDQDKKSLEAKEKELKSIQNEIKKLNYENGQLESLESSFRELKDEMKNDSDTVRNFNVRNPYLNFEYDEPEPNFDHKKVRGPLGKLFKLRDRKFARAVETAAGGKLYNIVVDNEMISSKLIEKGNLRRRATFAPLNKIQGRRCGQDLIKRAEQLVGKGNVFLAQDLIEYPPEYETVMSWSFGQVLVCTTIDVAEKVSTHRDIRKKAITLDGDVFDPSGVISGGAQDKNAPVLLAVMEVYDAEENLRKKAHQCDKIQRKINQLKPIASKYENFKQEFDLKTKEIEIVRKRLQQTSHNQLKQDLENLEKDINEKQQRIEECKQELKVKTAKICELEKNLKNHSSIKDREIKNAESELKRIKKKAEESRQKWKLREQEFETLKLEIEELEKAVENCKELILKSQETIEETSKDISNFSADLTKTQDSVKEIKDKVKAHREKIAEKNKEMQQMINQKEKLKKEIGEKELEILKDEQNIETIDDNHSKAVSLLKRLHQKYPWINEDREFFGQPNGMYDFTAHNPEEAEVKLEQIKQAQEKIGKHVNTNAMEVLNTQEEKYHELMKKKEIIEQDKLKILDVIGELDVKKEELIKTAWEKVNKDFNSIFHSLLPGAHAKLQPMEGKDVMAGLEVKVGFGGIWKDSLDELSGGQRSLVALSLILAMLLFKPAPLYILDEVDSALDPSHTQNIGQMLKAHFKQSQFIVVSLKDGMFNNANVLFRTSFVDGMSTVTRTTNTNN